MPQDRQKGKQVGAWSIQAIQVLQQYAQYGGMENYKNFWLYAQSLLSGENEKVKARRSSAGRGFTILIWTGSV